MKLPKITCCKKSNLRTPSYFETYSKHLIKKASKMKHELRLFHWRDSHEFWFYIRKSKRKLQFNFDWSQVPHLRHLSIKAQFCLRKGHLTGQLHTNQITDKRLLTPKHLIWIIFISINPETFSSSLWNSETSIQNKSASFEAPLTSQ